MIRKLLPALAAAIAFTAFPAASQVASAPTTEVAPPASPAEATPAPREGYVWAPGYYVWRDHDYTWVGGHWERAREGYRYVAPTWVQDNGHWRFTEEQWVQDEDHTYGRNSEPQEKER